MFRLRFSAVYVALALVAAASAYGSYRGLSAEGPARAQRQPATCKAPKLDGDPVMTAMVFIHAAVERANPKTGFALAAPALRGDTTCEDWARGNVPVKKFLQVDWGKAQYRIETRDATQLLLQVFLASSKLKSEPPGVFLLELHHVGADWRVGYFGPSDVEA
jgi:hypothetical protein